MHSVRRKVSTERMSSAATSLNCSWKISAAGSQSRQMSASSAADRRWFMLTMMMLALSQAPKTSRYSTQFGASTATRSCGRMPLDRSTLARRNARPASSAWVTRCRSNTTATRLAWWRAFLRMMSRRFTDAPTSLQDAAAVGERQESLLARHGRDELVEVPGPARLLGRLDLEHVHVVDLAAVRQDAPLAEQRIVGRHVLHGRDRLAAVAGVTDRLDRLEIVQHGGIDAGLHHGRVVSVVARGPALAPRPRARRQVPIEGLADVEAVRRREAERLDVGDHGRQPDDDLPALRQLELVGLLDCIGGVGPTVGERD